MRVGEAGSCGGGVHRSCSTRARQVRAARPGPTLAPMCGRYAATKHQADLVEELEVELDATGKPTRSVMAHAQNPPAG